MRELAGPIRRPAGRAAAAALVARELGERAVAVGVGLAIERVGAAAELAGVPKALFLIKLADYGVETFDLTREELQRELSLA